MIINQGILEWIARIFEETADNERAHAEEEHGREHTAQAGVGDEGTGQGIAVFLEHADADDERHREIGA